ncbi:radical SAM protein [Oceanispirochaeta crateris]|uniref:Radical SAM protein n=1 Tax=Oceanispirochaeta crateris TaxID=2518645 RepID=A0A5C1QQ24_9SPIO|nr:radical SAM protein [Oceanispirochaeta crateris]QEN09607.1 radical SAM protein [Oceanispirochaeta crateris]
MNILLITPPFCQLNTPYPGTAFLKGWLQKSGHLVDQADTSLETYLRLFSRKGLEEYVFGECRPADFSHNDSLLRTWNLRQRYMETIDLVLSYLQGKDTPLATLLCRPGFLPEGERFDKREEGLPASYGTLGISDKARMRATLYLEDLADFHRDTLDADFGFSRYAEHLAMSPPSFDDLYKKTQLGETPVSRIHTEILGERMESFKPDMVGFSVPFPGNLTEALRGARFIKQNYPGVHLTLGGGYINTELRNIGDIRLEEYFDSITLDDGEDALSALVSSIESGDTTELIRTWQPKEGKWCFFDTQQKELRHKERPAPDYSDLPLDQYLSLVDMENPMHRLWSEGPWIKMMLAHGCYWRRCAFCDTSLDYISRFDPAPASLLADQIEELIQQTGKRSFHFVDEAAPPSLMKELALELIRRKTDISWWTNIRFEKNFNSSLCRLLARSGCIAVSGGLEVASDRLLKSMDKGVTVQQVSAVTAAFGKAGIMVHAYLMYGFPGQTRQELMDSLDVVRQLFQNRLIHSAYWHHFALTAHSPVGCHPEEFGVTITGPKMAGFARNDLEFSQESEELKHYGKGLRTALYNYMSGKGFQVPVKKWFSFKTVSPRIPPKLIENLLEKTEELQLEENSRLVWTESIPEKSPNGLVFRGNDYQEEMPLTPNEIDFILILLKRCLPEAGIFTLDSLDQLTAEYGLDTDEWLGTQEFRELMEYGLLVL